MLGRRGPRRRPSQAPSCGSWAPRRRRPAGRARRRRARRGLAGVARRGGDVHGAQDRAAARVRDPARSRRRPAAHRAALPALPRRDPRIRQGGGRRRPPQPDRPRRGRHASGARDRRCGRDDRVRPGAALVGYRAVPLPDVPFDERHFVLPNERGRVLAPDGEPLPGVYAVGWIKRGPTGILGTNKRDAEETVTASSRIWTRARCRSRRSPAASRSTRCWPSARRTWSPPRAGARSTPTSSSAGAASSARGSSWRRARNCSPRLAPDDAPRRLVRQGYRRWGGCCSTAP